MTARTSMANLIATLRGFTNAGTADYSIGSTAYWSDDQLQSILDRNRVNLREVPLTSHPLLNSGGSFDYNDYQAECGWLETTLGGTARFIVTDGMGSAIGTANWTADYEIGLVTFLNNQAGSARAVIGFSYDVYAAAADIWQQKAAAYAAAVDFSTINHSIKRSHIVANCERMAQKYSMMATTGQGTAGSTRTDRGDQSTGCSND